MAEKELSSREKLFADTWLSNGQNALQAYKKISPKATDKTAGVEGAKYLKKPRVQAYIKSKQEQTSKKLNITRETQIERLNKLYETEADRVTDKVAILQEQSKLLGLYSPEIHKNFNFESELTENDRRDLDAALPEARS